MICRTTAWLQQISHSQTRAAVCILMCFKHQPLERSCQPTGSTCTTAGSFFLSFLAVCKKKTAFSKPVTVCISDLCWKVFGISSLILSHSGPKTILELPLRADWCVLSILSQLLKCHNEDLHFAIGTAATGCIPINGIQSGRLPGVKILTVEPQ